MKSHIKKTWISVCIAGLLCFGGAVTSHGATIILQAFVSFQINDNGGSNALADGSIVYLIGTPSQTVQPPVSWGVGGDLIANSVQPDNVFVATIRIGDGIFGTGSGQFAVALEVPDNLQYFYIRFFDHNVDPVEGLHYWGTSAAVQQQLIFDGMYYADFAPSADLSANQQNNFVVIPEPGTMQLILLAGLFVVGLSMRFKRLKSAQVRILA